MLNIQVINWLSKNNKSVLSLLPMTGLEEQNKLTNTQSVFILSFCMWNIFLFGCFWDWKLHRRFAVWIYLIVSCSSCSYSMKHSTWHNVMQHPNFMYEALIENISFIDEFWLMNWCLFPALVLNLKISYFTVGCVWFITLVLPVLQVRQCVGTLGWDLWICGAAHQQICQVSKLDVLCFYNKCLFWPDILGIFILWITSENT